MRLIGLTGGIATGKSAVGRLLGAHGATVIDADSVAREVVEPGTSTLTALVDALGAGILDEAGRLDRRALRARIASEPETRATLNRITHPAIQLAMAQRVAEAMTAGVQLVVVEAALLVETGSYILYPELWVVTCTPATQRARLMARDGMTEVGADAMIATQLPLADKEAVSTTLLRNDSDAAALAAAVDAALRKQ
ncbi:MAG: dephospho-CoA kinase [Myxococcota bacterium]